MTMEDKQPPQAASPAEWRVVFLMRRIGSALRSGVDTARLHVTGAVSPPAEAPSAPVQPTLDVSRPMSGDEPVVQA
jgi:hypothetical protein